MRRVFALSVPWVPLNESQSPLCIFFWEEATQNSPCAVWKLGEGRKKASFEPFCQLEKTDIAPPRFLMQPVEDFVDIA